MLLYRLLFLLLFLPISLAGCSYYFGNEDSPLLTEITTELARITLGEITAASPDFAESRIEIIKELEESLPQITPEIVSRYRLAGVIEIRETARPSSGAQAILAVHFDYQLSNIRDGVVILENRASAIALYDDSANFLARDSGREAALARARQDLVRVLILQLKAWAAGQSEG